MKFDFMNSLHRVYDIVILAEPGFLNHTLELCHESAPVIGLVLDFAFVFALFLIWDWLLD